MNVTVAPGFFRQLCSVVLCPFGRQSSVGFLCASVIRFVFRVPLCGHLVSLVGGLLSFPGGRLTANVPFLGPVLCYFSIIVLKAPTFYVSRVFYGGVVGPRVLLVRPRVGPWSSYFFSFVRSVGASPFFYLAFTFILRGLNLVCRGEGREGRNGRAGGCQAFYGHGCYRRRRCRRPQVARVSMVIFLILVEDVGFG